MSGKIPLAGVIGSPIAHSKSPYLHGYWLKKYDIKGHYVHLDIALDDLKDALKMMPKMGFVGVNVTLPHKEAVLKLADVVTDRAALVGAANTLTFLPDGRLHADNTDGYGFIENIRQNAVWDPKSGPVAVLGAGGAARAVLCSLIESGAEKILLSNRTIARAEALRAEFGSKIEVVDWRHIDAMLQGAMTVVNTTSLGMTGKPDLQISLDALSPKAVVCDLVYTPLQTDLLKNAAKIGCQTVDGLGMLLYQATPGFERWFGQRPEVDDQTRNFVLNS